jgi:hypothetical protein
MNDFSGIIHINRIDLLVMLLSVYVMYESASAIFNMPGGYRLFCHKAKYVVSAVVSVAAFYYALIPLPLDINYLICGMQISIFLFVWPRMVFRVKRFVTIFREWPYY